MTLIRIKRFTLALSSTAILFSPWIFTYMHQAKVIYETFWAKLPSPIGAFKIWGSIVLFWSPQLAEWFTNGIGLPFIKPVIWISLLAPTCMLMLLGAYYALKGRFFHELVIILSLFIYPAVILIVSILVKPLMVNKILIPSLSGLIVLLLIPLEKSGPTPKRFSAILIALFFIISGSLTVAMVKTDQSVDWHEVGSVISQKSARNDLILFYRDHGSLLFSRYSHNPDTILKGVTGNFEKELMERRVQGDLWIPHYRSIDSPENLRRLDQIVKGRSRFFLVLFPMYEHRVSEAEGFLLGLWHNYSVKETIICGQARIYLFSRSSELGEKFSPSNQLPVRIR